MPDLVATRCAICGTAGNSTELYAANLDQTALSPSTFSARRVPDRLHFRLVRCLSCGLVRSDPVADPATLEQLYSQSSFTYGGEVANLRRTYGSYLDLASQLVSRRDALLEIGCGSGFFLEEALARGWRTVQGVEPGREAAAAASETVRRTITCAMMRPGLFPRESFDLVCMFQVFDHFPDPAGIVNACREVLRPGGLVLAINHNMEAMSARLLGERSPVFDIEHTFLWSPRTMARVFADGGFERVRSGAVYNRFSLGYLARLAPLPGALKRATLALLEGSRLGRLPLTLPLGNLYFIGRKAMEPANR